MIHVMMFWCRQREQIDTVRMISDLWHQPAQELDYYILLPSIQLELLSGNHISHLFPPLAAMAAMAAMYYLSCR